MSQHSSRLFTSESVTEGHPDKICDAISDSILDALLAKDPRSRVAVETMVTTGQVHVAGEVTTEAYADIPTIVREKILEIGYDSSAEGLRRQLVRRERRHRRAVPGHRAGRRHRVREPGRGRRRRDRQAGRGRPGPDVRLRVHRHARADAAADRARAPPVAPADRGPQGRHRAVPAPGRQDPGHHRVRGRPAGAPRHRRHLHAARRRHRPGEAARRRPPRARGRPRDRRAGPRHLGRPPARQPHRPLRHRRPDG